MSHETPTLKLSLSLDLDNLWCYLKMRGDDTWKKFPSYYSHFIPQALDYFDALDLKLTFFIVGKDASQSENHDLLKEIVKRGHDIANHSFSHDPTMQYFTKEDIEADILQAEEAIYAATGVRTDGFRGPGFCFNQTICEVLTKHNYLYDSSLFPTIISPLARLYYHYKASLSQESQSQSKALYGNLRDGFRSPKDHVLNCAQGNIYELPVTTMPFLKLPFHQSYLFYLYQKSPKIMSLYLSTAISLCRFSRTEPNFLLHPTDILGYESVPELKFFPGMKLPTEQKKEVLNQIISEFKKHFYIVTMKEKVKGIHEKNLVRAGDKTRSD
ncbi:MAG: polysaccharide deacetylase family protein [Chlamydiales bacterium]